MIERPRVSTKNGKWIELTEEEIAKRSNFSKEGKKLDNLAETPELIRAWSRKLMFYNREVETVKGVSKDTTTIEEKPKKRGRPAKKVEETLSDEDYKKIYQKARRRKVNTETTDSQE